MSITAFVELVVVVVYGECRTDSSRFKFPTTGNTRQNLDMIWRHTLFFNYESGKCALDHPLHSTWLAQVGSSALSFIYLSKFFDQSFLISTATFFRS